MHNALQDSSMRCLLFFVRLAAPIIKRKPFLQCYSLERRMQSRLTSRQQGRKYQRQISPLIAPLCQYFFEERCFRRKRDQAKDSREPVALILLFTEGNFLL